MNLFNGDCLEVMKELPDNSIDFILTDLPYGKTGLHWDNIISFNAMWEQIKRIRKDNTAIALFGTEPFATNLKNSNFNEYKFDWYWKKSKGIGHLNAKKRPMLDIELISMFYKKQPMYNPQNLVKANIKRNNISKRNNITSFYSKEKDFGRSEYTNYPTSTLEFTAVKYFNRFHNTQKPIALLEYLIKTYTKENETVLDFTMGSGSTGVACLNTNRNFVGIELDKEYFQIAEERCKNER
jgi:site-specific DNA-methyltransferase (adenine-specific)